METKLLRWKKVSFKTLLKTVDRRRKPNVKREWVPVAGGSNTESIVTTLSKHNNLSVYWQMFR